MLWLRELNNKQGKNTLSDTTFETMLDKLEKSCRFVTKFKQNHNHVDDAALCNVCLDGTSYPSNTIIFCDMCNMAVHQDCYGVPYVPEGFWLCRPCLLSPSTPVGGVV